MTPFHESVFPLARKPSVIRLNPPRVPPPHAPPRLRGRPLLAGAVSWASGHARVRRAEEASHSNGPISGRVAPLFLSFSTLPPQSHSRPHSPGTPSRPPTRPHWPTHRAAPSPTSPASARSLREGRERLQRRGPCVVTSRVEARRSGAAGEVWPTGGYKRAAVRARPAQCGWALGAGGVQGALLSGRRRQRGVERGRWGLPRAAAAAVGPPAPAGGGQSAGRGPGGTCPRPATVMVSAEARPGRGGQGPPWRRRRGPRSLSRTPWRIGVGASLGSRACDGPAGLPGGGAGAEPGRPAGSPEGKARLSPIEGSGALWLVGVPGAGTLRLHLQARAGLSKMVSPRLGREGDQGR